MNVKLLYLNVTRSGYPGAAPPEYYVPMEERWVRTLLNVSAGYPNTVRVVSCGAPVNDEVRERYAAIPGVEFDEYLGAGSDIGACQDAMKRVDADMVVCMSTPVYFVAHGWLRRLVEAWETHGDGLYGPFSSYQNTPHIRTSCWCVNPKTFAAYPHKIDTREKCCWAESFDHEDGSGVPWQITKWYRHVGKPAMLVTWDGEWSWNEFRKGQNIFRRGDQGNCLVRDQHWDVYDVSHYHERIELAAKADTLTRP